MFHQKFSEPNLVFKYLISSINTIHAYVYLASFYVNTTSTINQCKISQSQMHSMHEPCFNKIPKYYWKYADKKSQK